MPRPREYPTDAKRGASSGRKVQPFIAGPLMTIVGDPLHCYILGGELPTGQVVETAAMQNWAEGTQFSTVVNGKTLFYQIYGRNLIKIKDPS